MAYIVEDRQSAARDLHVKTPGALARNEAGLAAQHCRHRSAFDLLVSVYLRIATRACGKWGGYSKSKLSDCLMATFVPKQFLT
jgi:hypothetical protein